MFEQFDKFSEWIAGEVKKEQYICYVTKYNEVILRPSKSTRSLDTGYAQLLTQGSVEKLVKQLIEKGVKIYGLGSIEWDTDKPVGVGVTPIPK